MSSKKVLLLKKWSFGGHKVFHRLQNFSARKKFAAYAFVAPALLLLLFIWVLPMLGALLISFTDFDIYTIANARNIRFAGLRNYIKITLDPTFWNAFGNTFYFVFVGGLLSVSVSLGAALCIHSSLVKFKSFFSTIFFAPVATTLVAVSLVWRFIYNTRYGVLNYTLSLLGIETVDWLGDPSWAMPSLILLTVWKNFGFNMIIFVAGLQSIPQTLYTAARIDGAGSLQLFRYITLPMLIPTFWFVGIITFIRFFQFFAEPYIMTQGGPLQSTTSIVYMMYEEGFKWWDVGYASAIAFTIFFFFLVGTYIYYAVGKWRDMA